MTWRVVSSVRSLIVLTVSFFALAAAIGICCVYVIYGAYGINALIRRGGSYWVSVDLEDPRLSDSMRLALRSKAIGTAGPFTWQTVGNGFDVAELPVLVEGEEVDRILLARIDARQFRFVVMNAPAGDRDLQDWMTRLKAAMVINGSYFSLHGTPDTPFLSNRVQLGPVRYEARQGAFVASETNVSILDLAHREWSAAFRGADNALVSYPLLVGGDPGEHQIDPSDWLANRSFVGQDSSGRIIVGTTQNAFFSLARLAGFLRNSPLKLSKALNLDGGPVACQGIAVANFSRRYCGKWEFQKSGASNKLLTWPYGSWGSFALPIVLAAVPRQ